MCVWCARPTKSIYLTIHPTTHSREEERLAHECHRLYHNSRQRNGWSVWLDASLLCVGGWETKRRRADRRLESFDSTSQLDWRNWTNAWRLYVFVAPSVWVLCVMTKGEDPSAMTLHLLPSYCWLHAMYTHTHLRVVSVTRIPLNAFFRHSAR